MRSSNKHQDDLTGAPGAGRVTLGINDVWFELDLTVENRTALAEALGPYLAVARPAGGSGSRARKRNGLVDQAKGRQIRAWAKDQGLPVASTGRIPNDIEAAFDAAHGARA